jgi:hypothetical protein
MAKRKTFLQKRKVRKTIKRRKTIKHNSIRRKMTGTATTKVVAAKPVITGGNYSQATYSGFKNKNATRVFYPGGSSTWREHVEAGDYPSRDDA